MTTSTTGWTTSIQTISTSKKYLWNYEIITYSNDTTNTTTPIIIGIYGDTGISGKDSYNVVIVPSATQFISENNGTSYTPITITLTPTFQNCNYNVWQYSTNGSTWTTVNSGSNGLTIANQILTISNTSELFDSNSSISFKALSDVSNVANTITITKYKYISDLHDRLVNINSNIDLSNQKITTLSSNLELLNESFSTIIGEQLEAEFGDGFIALEKQVSEMTQTVNQWAIDYNTLKEVTDSMGQTVSDEISKYMRFNSSGQLIIGRSDSVYQAMINNSSFNILSGGNTVATFSEGLLTTKNIKVSDSLELGNIILQSYNNGITFKWGGD